MAPESMNIRYATVAGSLVLVLIIEGLLRVSVQYLDPPSLARIGSGALGRLLQTAGMVWAVVHWERGLAAIGWSPRTWLQGLRQGAVWSAGFALVAGAGMILLSFAGYHPLSSLGSPLKGRTAELLLFFLLGGLIAPVAEEVFFRGILYGFFRRWGIAAALIASTAVFVALHTTQGLPVTQIVGGLVFALAYETTRNLMVPITIHVLGNLAIFTLSLPVLR